MLIISFLSAVSIGFLALLWLTPIGVPTLKRLGAGQISPDLRFGYRPDETYRLLNLYGTLGIAHWRRMLLIDMVFPAVYATLFVVLAMKWTAWADAGPIWRAVAIGCPILAGVSDYIENFLLLGVIKAYPRRIDASVVGASLFTRTKFIFSYATLAIPLLYWGASRIGWPV